MSTDGDARNGVQVVRRVAAILLALRGEQAGLTLSEIADRVQLPRSTVHRLIAALEQERFVVSASESGGFRLGPALAGLAMTAARELIVAIHPLLEEIAAEVRETVDLAVLQHDHVLFVDQVAAATQRLRAVSAIGAVFPAHCTANGKALLADLPDEEVTRLLPKRLDRLTDKTITSRADLLEELQQVRANGVAYDREEHTLGICAVGTVIEMPGGETAAITIPLPAQRFYGNEERLAKTLLSARARIRGVVGS
jgi:DNA-binding IclR family transcriptional regulator